MEQKGFIVKDSPNENASDLPYYTISWNTDVSIALILATLILANNFNYRTAIAQTA